MTPRIPPPDLLPPRGFIRGGGENKDFFRGGQKKPQPHRSIILGFKHKPPVPRILDTRSANAILALFMLLSVFSLSCTGVPGSHTCSFLKLTRGIFSKGAVIIFSPGDFHKHGSPSNDCCIRFTPLAPHALCHRTPVTMWRGDVDSCPAVQWWWRCYGCAKISSGGTSVPNVKLPPIITSLTPFFCCKEIRHFLG